MTENERVREIRKAKNMTLEKFGDLIGMGKSSISDIENGRRPLTDQTRLLICCKYSVNEEWLRSGGGPMFIEPASFDLGEFAKSNGATELELNFIKAYFGLPSEVRGKLIAYFKDSLASDMTEVSAEIKPADISLKTAENMQALSRVIGQDDDPEDYAYIARQQRVLEKKPDVSASYAKDSDVG